jgi:uncharacterized protein (DUF1697 family)
VVTHLTSGNVVFDAAGRAGRATLAGDIERALKDRAGVSSTVFLLSPAELRAASEANPFEPERRQADQLCHLVFLSDRPGRSQVAALMAAQGDEYRFAVKDTVCYMAYDRSLAGRRRAVDIERILGVPATARSWKVVRALVDLAER